MRCRIFIATLLTLGCSLFADFDQAFFDKTKDDFLTGFSDRREQFSSIVDLMQKEEYSSHPEAFLWKARSVLWAHLGNVYVSPNSSYTVVYEFSQIAPYKDVSDADLKACIQDFELCRRYAGKDLKLYHMATRELGVAEYMLSLRSFNYVLFNEAKANFFDNRLVAREKFDQLINALPAKFKNCYPVLFFWRGLCTFYDEKTRSDVEALRSCINDFKVADSYAPKGLPLQVAAKSQAEIAKFFLSIRIAAKDPDSKNYRKVYAVKQLVDAFKIGKSNSDDLEQWVIRKHTSFLNSLGRKIQLKPDEVSGGITLDTKRLGSLKNILGEDFPYPQQAFWEMGFLNGRE